MKRRIILAGGTGFIGTYLKKKDLKLMAMMLFVFQEESRG